MDGHVPEFRAAAENVRAATPEDRTALGNLFEAVGLFEPHELVGLSETVRGYFAGKMGPDHHWLVYDDEGGAVGAAYYAPDTSRERMAPGTWNLYFIGVLPSRQGCGCGGALIHHVENALTLKRATDLLVETSGSDGFEATRTFYRKHGYRVIARVADAYGVGDDKVIFRKRLAWAAH